jgi:hypothetical protein
MADNAAHSGMIVSFSGSMLTNCEEGSPADFVIIIITTITTTIIIIIIIIILRISFMQGIYTCIPETNHVPREHCVATFLM